MPVNGNSRGPEFRLPGKHIKAPKGNISWGKAITSVRKTAGNTFHGKR